MEVGRGAITKFLIVRFGEIYPCPFRRSFWSDFGHLYNDGFGLQFGFDEVGDAYMTGRSFGRSRVGTLLVRLRFGCGSVAGGSGWVAGPPRRLCFVIYRSLAFFCRS